MGHKGESSAETRCRGFLILEYQCFFSIGISISDVVAFCPLKKYLAITMLWATCLHFSMRWCFSPRISMFFFVYVALLGVERSTYPPFRRICFFHRIVSFFNLVSVFLS